MEPGGKIMRQRGRGRLWGGVAAVALLAACFIAGRSAEQASAAEIDFGNGLEATFRATLQVGAQMRVSDRDDRMVGRYNGGSAAFADRDDGNLNFDKYDLVSQISSVAAELKLRYEDYFATVSGYAFYDLIADRNDLAENGPESRPFRGRLDPVAQDEARYDAELREYYAGGRFEVFDNRLTARVGSQILNWGEALFTINGISVINPIDVKRVLVPGAELADALIPIPMARLTYELGEGLSLDAFVTFDFEPYKLPPCGSFFSIQDNGCRGVEGVSNETDFRDTRSYVPGRDRADDYDEITPIGQPAKPLLNVGNPIREEDPEENNDFGVSLRYFSPDLNNTEFQFFYVNYRSRLPVTYFRAPDEYAPGTGQITLPTSLAPIMGLLASGLDPASQQQIRDALADIGVVGDLLDPVVGQALAGLVSPPMGTFPRSAVLKNVDNSAFYLTYPDNINLFGAAFNTTIDSLGISLNGEVSYKRNVPVMLAGSYALAAFNQIGGHPSDGSAFGSGNFGIAPIVESPETPFDNQFVPGRVVTTYKRHDVWQAALRMMRVFGGTEPVVSWTGATSVVAIVEFGGLYVDLDSDFIYAATGDYGVTGFDVRGLTIGGVPVVPSVPADTTGYPKLPNYRPASKWSGGFNGLIQFEYPDLLPGVDVTPSIAFSTGLFGITPSPLPGFTKGLSSIKLGARFDLSQQFSVELSYFNAFGAGGSPWGSRNTLIDRDYVGVAATYKF